MRGRGRAYGVSVPYEQAVAAFKHSLPRTLDEAPRGHDTAAIDEQVAQLAVEVDAGEDMVNELFDVRINDKSQIARDRLQKAERELEETRANLRRAIERRDTLANTQALKRLAAVEKALTREPMDTEEANRALRGAVRKMVMRPQEGRLDVLWHHAEELQETLFMTTPL